MINLKNLTKMILKLVLLKQIYLFLKIAHRNAKQMKNYFDEDVDLIIFGSTVFLPGAI
jgi:hypothetical protein